MKFELREIDAIADGDNGWTWNTSYHLADFETKAQHPDRAFLRALHKRGIVCNRGKCSVMDDGDVLELIDRKTGEPLFAAIPRE